ncbi:MAG: phosphoglycerate dehydrogenase [Bacteroidetes bacterium]|nr:MAG: phosphoglycerate dehydrogenase [Bacteroidota bacterium]
MNVLVIDAFPDAFMAALSSLPVQVMDLREATAAEARSALPSAHILILNSKIRLNAEATPDIPLLRGVIRAGVGMDHIDVAWLEGQGVSVRNTQGANAAAVGEQTVGMLLSLRHQLRLADQSVRAFRWERETHRGREIGGKTIGLIGYGHTGQAVARRLSGFGATVLAYDKYRQGYSDAYATEASMEAIFARAEILSLHVPLTEETHYLVNTDYLTRFAHPLWLLNLARGPVVHLPSLLAALDSGKVVAAALDVLENEKLDTLSPEQEDWYRDLFARDNVLLSPHIGGWSFESRDQINQRILDHVRSLLSN